MKARILKTGFLGGYYTDDFFLENKEKEFNNELVSNWDLTDVLPNNLLVPFWNGSFWVEAISSNEITANEEKQDKNDQAILEQKGLNLYENTKNRLIRRNKKSLITKTRCKRVRDYLHPIFLLLRTGDIDIANDRAILLPIDTNADINAELVLFKTKIAALLSEVNTLI